MQKYMPLTHTPQSGIGSLLVGLGKLHASVTSIDAEKDEDSMSLVPLALSIQFWISSSTLTATSWWPQISVSIPDLISELQTFYPAFSWISPLTSQKSAFSNLNSWPIPLFLPLIPTLLVVGITLQLFLSWQPTLPPNIFPIQSPNPSPTYLLTVAPFPTHKSHKCMSVVAVNTQQQSGGAETQFLQINILGSFCL